MLIVKNSQASPPPAVRAWCVDGLVAKIQIYLGATRRSVCIVRAVYTHGPEDRWPIQLLSGYAVGVTLVALLIAAVLLGLGMYPIVLALVVASLGAVLFIYTWTGVWIAVFGSLVVSGLIDFGTCRKIAAAQLWTDAALFRVGRVHCRFRIFCALIARVA